jgi:hypothetical protein
MASYARMCAIAVGSHKSDQVQQVHLIKRSAAHYALRNHIERCTNRLKNGHHVAT